jgi:hypothetical protein
MFKWLSKILGSGAPVDVMAEVFTEPKSKKAAPKKKAPKVDLDSMSKKDLLAHAKKTGVKANASMNKAALIKILK